MKNTLMGGGVILPNVSHCIAENDVHYNPKTKPQETRVVAKFNVTDTSNPTQICGHVQGLPPFTPEQDYSSGFTSMEIDGVILPNVSYQYQFDTLGEHTVKYTLTDPTSIGERAFYYCSGLTSIDIPDSVTSIGNSAFYYCSGLTSIDIPSGVTSISNGAFSYCTSLTSIDIPGSVTSIGTGAFNGCYGLTSIDIPGSVTSIGNGAFSDCSGLTSIVSNATTPPTLHNGAFNFTNDCPIYVPSVSVETYKSATGWSMYADRIQAMP